MSAATDWLQRIRADVERPQLVGQCIRCRFPRLEHADGTVVALHARSCPVYEEPRCPTE